ncbi:MAG: cyclase family protein [Leptolinea sp.]
MKFWDISVAISKDLPVWPGDPKSVVERVHKIEEGANANVSRMEISCHTGTHVDAPFHFLPGTNTVESLSLDILVGPVQVIHIPDDFSVITGDLVTACGIKSGTKRVLFRTFSSTFWAKYGSQFRTEFVGIDKSGAEALVNMGIQLVGTDYLSVSPFKQSRPTHEVLLTASVILLEGLDLSKVDAGEYTLICLPVKIEGADGAPARAILMREN